MAAVRLDDEGGRWLELAQVIAAWGEPALPPWPSTSMTRIPACRRTVALAIGDMRPKTLPDALRMLLGDRDEWVRDSAVVGLCRISGNALCARDPAPPEVIKAVVPLLIEVLANPRLPVDRSDVIISTLGQIGPDHPAAVPTLLKTLKQSSQRQHSPRPGQRVGRAGRPLAERRGTQAHRSGPSDVVRAAMPRPLCG